MKRRDSESPHFFAGRVFEELNITDMQGLLIGEDGKFTVALEAFEVEADEAVKIFGLLSPGEAEKKVELATRVGVPFALVVHREGLEKIFLYYLGWTEPRRLGILGNESLSEEEFLQWWAQNKQTRQVKNYNEIRSRMKDSYFDHLLESHGQKWGGNVDGVMYADSRIPVITGIIEKRITDKMPLASYDPANFFNYRGGDYHTWLPVYNLARMLNVPLYLFTFQQRNDTQVGITIVASMSKEGIHYIKNSRGGEIRPCDNIFEDFDKMKEWILEQRSQNFGNGENAQ